MKNEKRVLLNQLLLTIDFIILFAITWCSNKDYVPILLQAIFFGLLMLAIVALLAQIVLLSKKSQLGWGYSFVNILFSLFIFLCISITGLFYIGFVISPG